MARIFLAFIVFFSLAILPLAFSQTADKSFSINYNSAGLRIIEVRGGSLHHVWHVLKVFEEKYKHTNDFYSFNKSRPALACHMDAYIACAIAENLGCPLYIVHVAVGDVVEVANYFRARGNTVYMETSARHLMIDDKGTKLKEPILALSMPGYMPRENQAQLWKGLGNNEVNTIGTDSGALKRADKLKKPINVWKMPIGWQELPTSLAMMLSEGVNKKRITLPQLVGYMSTNAAKIFDIFPKKGAILPGSDADITIVDLNKKQVVRPEDYPSWGDYTPYEGWELKGWPVLTMVRGKVVMEDGKVFDAPGWGRPVNLE